MDNPIVLDYYTINFINACITFYCLAIAIVLFIVFARQHRKHSDKISAFFLALSALLVIYPAFAIAVQIGQGLGLTEYRTMFVTGRFFAGLIMAAIYTLGLILFVVINNERDK